MNKRKTEYGDYCPRAPKHDYVRDSRHAFGGRFQVEANEEESLGTGFFALLVVGIVLVAIVLKKVFLDA